jgi:hypothetical protein
MESVVALKRITIIRNMMSNKALSAGENPAGV